MTRLTVGDRLSAAAVGLFFGAIIGFALAWLVGVYSNTLGPSAAAVDFKHWVSFCALGLGVVGLLFGPVVGTLLGLVISGIFKFERAEDQAAPTWLLVVVVLAVVAGVWLSAT